MPDEITLTAPDDWHIHLRDGEALELTVADAAQNVERAIVMPNLVPPVINASQALAYKARINSAIPTGLSFEPLMVLYLTDNTTPSVISEAKQAGVVGCKLYPAGATTNSDSGVTDITHIYPALEAMSKAGMVLQIHGEVTDASVDIFDREAQFIEKILSKIIEDFPELKIVFEHITTKEACDFVRESDDNLAATITAHHLLFDRNDMLVGGIKPHYYCLPILKRRLHREALLNAATSGLKQFFLGSDSAPHIKELKENACGCAGAYTANALLPLYAEAFEGVNALEKLEAFASFFGPNFYGLPRNKKQVRLVKEPWKVPRELNYGNSSVIPLMSEKTINWRMIPIET